MKPKLIISILITGILVSACDTSVSKSPTIETSPTIFNSPSPLPPTNTPIPPTATSQPTETITPEPILVSFVDQIVPVLQSRCVNCHGGERLEEGLSMLSYGDLMKGSDNGIVIIPGDSDNSMLVQMILAGKMPKRGPKLTPAQVQLIIDWIDQGALDN